jgi:hypothetical protein
MVTSAALPVLNNVDVSLDRDLFLRDLIRELSGALQDVIGLPDASGFISVVGKNVGEGLNAKYKAALNVDRLSREQVAAVCLDLKRRIQGDFYIMEFDEKKIVFGNRACPFGDRVIGRPSMCMMTSNVFGSIAAENLGYAKVELLKTIAQGDKECQVVVFLERSQDSDAASGREYFQAAIPE